MRRETKRFGAAMTLGAIAGMRSMAAPAVVSHRLSQRMFGWPRNPVETVLRDELAAQILLGAAAAEMVADKLPFAPARIRPLPLAVRTASGALMGWVLGGSRDSRAFLAVVGGAAALVTTFAAYGIRKAIAENSIVPDALVGIAEDAAVVSLAKNLKL